VTPCSCETYQRSGETCYLHSQGLIPSTLKREAKFHPKLWQISTILKVVTSPNTTVYILTAVNTQKSQTTSYLRRSIRFTHFRSLFYERLCLGKNSTMPGCEQIRLTPETDASRPALGLHSLLLLKYRGVKQTTTAWCQK
jgi:hypothetical protein